MRAADPKQAKPSSHDALLVSPVSSVLPLPWQSNPHPVHAQRSLSQYTRTFRRRRSARAARTRRECSVAWLGMRRRPRPVDGWRGYVAVCVRVWLGRLAARQRRASVPAGGHARATAPQRNGEASKAVLESANPISVTHATCDRSACVPCAVLTAPAPLPRQACANEWQADADARIDGEAGGLRATSHVRLSTTGSLPRIAARVCACSAVEPPNAQRSAAVVVGLSLTHATRNSTDCRCPLPRRSPPLTIHTHAHTHTHTHTHTGPRAVPCAPIGARHGRHRPPPPRDARRRQ